MDLRAPSSAVASWVESSFRSVFRGVDVGSDGAVEASHIGLGVAVDTVLALASWTLVASGTFVVQEHRVVCTSLAVVGDVLVASPADSSSAPPALGLENH